MAGNSNEPGGPPQSERRNAGGPADRDRLVAEDREDPRIPFEARGDDVRRDREGHGPAATGGQHCDAGTPSAEMGRQEGHQEGRQRSARPLVSPEPAVGRHPRAHRPGRTGEDRPDRGESQEAQDIRVGSSVRTPIWDATTTAWAIFRKRPWPTTPGMPEIRAASFPGPRIGPKCASRMWFPLSVRNGSPPSLRNSTFAPRPSRAADAFFQPNGWTSTGSGVFVPRRRTSFESSTITTNFFDAAATIFSRNKAPPIPLIRSSFGSTSSAPSTVRSSQKLSSSEVNGIPMRFASSAVASDVGTPFRSIPFATRRATPARKCRAVDPVPRPRTIPGFTYARAASAAFRLSSSREAISGPPPQFLDQLHDFPDHEIVELLAQRLRRFRRIPRDAGPVLPRVGHHSVRRDFVLPRRALALYEIGARGHDPRRLPRARVAIALRKDALRRVDDVVIGEDGRSKARPLVDDFLGGGTQRHHVLPPRMAAQDHHAPHAVANEICEDVADEALQRVDRHADGPRVRPGRCADAVRDGGGDNRVLAALDLVEDVERLDDIRAEGQMPAVFLECADGDDDHRIFLRNRGEFLGGHLVEAHAAESARRP